MTNENRPVRLILTSSVGAPPRVSLIDWIHRRPEFRPAVRDAGGGRPGGRAGFSDAVIIAVVAHSLLPGLFGLIQTWITEQRSQTTVRVLVADSEIEVQVDGRADPHRLIADLTTSIRAAGIEAGGDSRAAAPPTEVG
jgi:hypothetical protein